MLPQPETGTLPASFQRSLKPSDDQLVASLLTRYAVQPEDFEWQLEPLRSLPRYDIYQLTFPSPAKTIYPENRTVYAEYYRICRGGTRPGVVVLDIAEGSMVVPRLVVWVV